MRAVEAKALHLGGDETADVDPDRECYPAGQGVGAIDELVPAGELVRRIVDEAERRAEPGLVVCLSASSSSAGTRRA